jgi:hypothetical protein
MRPNATARVSSAGGFGETQCRFRILIGSDRYDARHACASFRGGRPNCHVAYLRGVSVMPTGDDGVEGVAEFCDADHRLH